MKDIKEILILVKELMFQKAFLGFIGILLVVLSATNGIKTAKLNITIDIYGRVIVFALGIILFISAVTKVKFMKFAFPSKNITPLFINKPIEITATKKNEYNLKNDFIFWKKCSIMFWIYVPPKGEKLRNSPSNRYIFAYHNGATKPNHIRTSFFNQFTIRHNSVHEKWDIAISDSSAEYIPKTF